MIRRTLGAAEVANACKLELLNPLKTLEFVSFLRNNIEVRFKTGLEIECSASDRDILLTLLQLTVHGVRLVDYWQRQSDSLAWKISWSDRNLTLPDGLTFDLHSVDPAIFTETFLYDVHFVDFNLDRMTVVDVGGFVGDTALYYAKRGGTVFVYEPNPVNYRYLLRNLELNPALKNAVTAFNKAVGRDGNVTLWYNPKFCKTGLVRPANSLGTAVSSQIESVSLSTILRENHIEKPYLLKSDCKGCEIELLKDQAISQFQVVKLEYTLEDSDMNANDVMKMLMESGYEHVRCFKHSHFRYDLAKHGTIIASK